MAPLPAVADPAIVKQDMAGTRELNIQPFPLDETLWLIDTGLYRVEERTLVLADLHLGYEAAMRQGGVMLPETRLDALFRRLDQIFMRLDVSQTMPLQQLIVNGDLRHTFGPLNDSEWREMNAFFDHVLPFCQRLIVIQGNHDPTMTAFVKRFSNIEIDTQHQQDHWLYVHGDQIPKLGQTITHIVIGHEHPALALKDPVTGRRERYKAFLKGVFRERILWVIPSCNTLISGTDLRKEGILSPLLRESGREQSDVFVRDDVGQIYAFGRFDQLP